MWGDAKEVKTVHGTRLLRKADPDFEINMIHFWKIWKRQKDYFKTLGLGVSCYRDVWSLDWWIDPINPISMVTLDFEPEQTEESQYSPKYKALIHAAVRQIAGGCDGASTLDGRGFSKIDVEFGHSLAAAASLSDKQIPYAAKLARKHKRQLSSELMAIIEKEAP